MKAPAGIQTVTQYLAGLPAERRATLRTLHRAIRKAAPTLKPGVDYGMIGYGIQKYRYASGRAGTWPVVALASQKHHFSLYLCVCDGEGYLPELHKTRLGNVSVGRSCIRFRKLENLNLKVALSLVRRSVKLVRQKSSTAT